MINVREIKLEKRYPESRQEDITDAFTRGYTIAVEIGNKAIKKLETENGELCKLVRDMWHQSCTYDTTCDGCPRYVKHWDGTEECEFETRIIKLGIEVGYEW